MADWKTRLKKLRYRSPKGKSFTIEFDDVSRQGGRKASITEFPGQDLPDIRDLGEKVVTIPVNCYFTGADYDTQADRFWKALSEPGFGLLRHPRWGDITVLATDRTQIENFTDSGGVAKFQVTFQRVEDDINFLVRGILSKVELVTNVVNAVVSFVDDVGRFVSSTLQALSVGVFTEIRDTIRSAKNILKDGFKDIVSEYSSLTSSFDSLLDEFGSNEDFPLALEQLYGILSIVSGLNAPVAQKTKTFNRVFDNFILNLPEEQIKTNPLPYNANLPQYENAQSAVYALTMKIQIFVNWCLCVVDGNFNTRSEAIAVYENLISVRFQLIAEIERVETAFSIEYPIELVQRMDTAFNLALRAYYFLGSIARIENSFVVQNETNILPLLLSLYGNTWLDRLEEFLTLNNFQDYEFFLLPQGMTVRYLE